MNQAKMTMREIYEDLVDRKLWPIAVVLVIALIAIPVVLAKPASKSSAPAPVLHASTDLTGVSSPLTAFDPVVSTSSSDNDKKGLHGGAKNPFLAKGGTSSSSSDAGSVTPTSSSASAAAAGSGAVSVAGGDTSASGQTGSGDSSSGSGNSTPAPSKSTTKYYTYTAKVHFGQDGNEQLRTIEQFRALPSSDNPVAVFMGVKSDGKTAAFLLSSSATTTGDGRCEPSESSCSFLYMKKGDSRVIEAVAEDGSIVTYTLDLVSIGTKRVDTPKASRASKKAHDSSRKHKHKRRAKNPREQLALKTFGRLSF